MVTIGAFFGPNSSNGNLPFWGLDGTNTSIGPHLGLDGNNWTLFWSHTATMCSAGNAFGPLLKAFPWFRLLLFDNFFPPPKTILSSCLALPSLQRVPEIRDISNMEISHRKTARNPTEKLLEIRVISNVKIFPQRKIGIWPNSKCVPTSFQVFPQICQIFKVSFTTIDMSESIRKSQHGFGQIKE